MKTTDISSGLLQAFDQASNGNLGRFLEACAIYRFEADLSVQTHLDGLPEGDMRLLVSVFRSDQTVVFFTIPLEGSAQILGWNLVIDEAVKQAKKSVEKAQQHLLCDATRLRQELRHYRALLPVTAAKTGLRPAEQEPGHVPKLTPI